LCDLQTQGVCAGASFSFGTLERHFNFLPRVEYKQCILHPATWLLIRKDFEELTTAANEQQEAAFATFRKQWNLPEIFILADGDNELMLDSRNGLMRNAFMHCIKKRGSIKVKEFIGENTAVSDAAGRPYLAQFIGLVVKNGTTYIPAAGTGGAAVDDLKERFIPGSEWLYVKLYCGFKTADRILQEVIGPGTAVWLREGVISKWFFIRYADPQFHVRVRFLLTDAAMGGVLLQLLHQAVEPFVQEQLVSKVQVDTYEREVSRYGHNTMEISETVFYYDSRAVVGMLAETTEENREDCRWLWAMRVADNWLSDVGLTDQQKLNFVQRQRELFGKEFHADGTLALQLDKKYRKYKRVAEDFMQDGSSGGPEHLQVMEVCDLRRRELLPVINGIPGVWRQGDGPGGSESIEEGTRILIEQFSASHIHMMVNRVMMANARLQEMIVYDFLSRYYQSVIARKRGVK
jgi:thiopeptide-type bacteriocin biosynthesis protein